MRALAALFLTALPLAQVLFAQVQNAADASAGIQGSSPIVPGAQGFVSDFTSSPLSIAGSAVSIRPVGSSTAIPAEVLNVSFSGITFLVPPDVPVGNAQLIYRQSGQLTQWTGVSVAPTRFALYRDPVRAVNVNASGPATPNGLANPAQPGQPVEIFGTGLGAMPQTPPQVMLGGVPQTVLYADVAPGEAGVMQINFQISAATPDGCYVPLNVIWGAGAATSWLSKTSDGMPCHHPFQLSLDALKALDAGTSLETGSISMTTALTAASADVASRQENANIFFLPAPASMTAGYFAANPAPGCGAGQGSGATFAVLSGVFQLGDTMTLRSAATTLTLAGEGSLDYLATIPPSADAPLDNLPAPVLAGGPWTWSSSGGADLAASSFPFTLAPPVRIDGGAPFSIASGQDRVVTWNGGAFDSNATVQLSVSANAGSFQSVVCFAPAQAGTLTIPAAMLARFSPGSVGELSVSVTESGAGIPHAEFHLANGDPLLMLVHGGSTDTRPVDFQ